MIAPVNRRGRHKRLIVSSAPGWSSLQVIVRTEQPIEHFSLFALPVCELSARIRAITRFRPIERITELVTQTAHFYDVFSAHAATADWVLFHCRNLVYRADQVGENLAYPNGIKNARLSGVLVILSDVVITAYNCTLHCDVLFTWYHLPVMRAINPSIVSPGGPGHHRARWAARPRLAASCEL